MTRRWLVAAAGDARLAVRLLFRRPGFAALAVLTLALGIGAPTAIFSVVHAVLLRPLPYPDADRIVQFQMTAKTRAGSISFQAMPVTTAREWGLSTATLTDISVFNDRSLTLSTPDGPFRLTGVAAAPSLFEVLGVAPLRGRVFDKTATDARQIVLSRGTWQQYFGERDVIDTPITLDGEAYRVVGVMPDDFRFPTADAAFWVPLMIESSGGRGMLLPAVARLRPDTTVAAVVEEGRQVLERGGTPRDEMTLSAPTLHDQLVGGSRRVLWILMAAVSLVSIIATTNIALLLLVRGAARAREFAIRQSVGARRGQLVRQLFVEALTLAALGGAVGLLLATGIVSVVVGLAPPELPRLQDVTLSGPALLFAGALAVVTSVIFCLLSAGRTLALRPLGALGPSSADALPIAVTPRRRLRVLAAVEIALTLVLLVGAGLLIRSLISRVLIDQGFDGTGALAMQISLPPSRYPSQAERQAFHEQLLERLPQISGARVAGLAVSMPNRQATARFDFGPEARPADLDPAAMHVAEVRSVSEGFFEAMGVPLVAGRTFRASDNDGAEPAIVISQSLARQHYPNGEAVGRILYSRTGNRRVIGIVGDVRPAAPDGRSSPAAAYLTFRQDAGVFEWFAGMTIVLRGPDPRSLAAPMRALVLSMDPGVPPFNVRLLDDDVSQLVAGPRFSASVLAAFAIVALVLAAIGVYGVMAYTASQRTREIGVRIALGATDRQVLRMILRDGLVIVGAGLLAGIAVAIWSAQGLTGLLYEVRPADPLTLAGMAAILAVVGLVAIYVPARRATRINAVEALRAE